MKQQWEQQDIDMKECLDFARKLADTKKIPSKFGSSISYKNQQQNIFGETETALTLSAQNISMQDLDSNGLTTLWQKQLEKALGIAALPESDLIKLLISSKVNPQLPDPVHNGLLHAAIHERIVVIVRPESVMAISCLKDSPELIEKVFDGKIGWVPFRKNGIALAQALQTAWKEKSNRVNALVVQHLGLIVAGTDFEEVYGKVIEIIESAESYLLSLNIRDVFDQANTRIQGGKEDYAQERKRISELIGQPVILTSCSDPGLSETYMHGGFGSRLQSHIALEDIPTLGLFDFDDQNPEAYLSACHEKLQGNISVPHVVRHSKLGLCFIGADANESRLIEDVFSQYLKTKLRSEKIGEIESLDENIAADILLKSVLAKNTFAEGQETLLRGEIALVTGAASGIGEACVESLLARGAAVVGLDINPAIAEMMNRPDFLGIRCDISDEASVHSAVETTAQTFGGLDIMVLNAGVFPSSCRIDSLKMADWDYVMRINLDANLSIMRETYPLLKHSPKDGRVVVNASRNALAPGPGAAAYSVSKMGLTQLARIAALEWGNDRIRVNIIHPDAVFDTGVWAGNVLQKRAENYGMTVDQYKRRNILKTELTSHYVGELVAEMCGPLFQKITGAQIPVDGGSDRVI